jgi:hypothetical protein
MSDTPNSTTRQQQEAARFRSAVSEALVQGMQGNINYLLASILPVGSVVASMLTEAQFQDEASDGWVIADGRNVSASAYALLTGFTTAPDLRGVFIRGKNDARSSATGNSGGDKALGTYEADQFAAHTHPYLYRVPNAGSGGSDGGGDTDRALSDINSDTSSAGTGTETRPRSVTINYFIRIN